MAAGRPGLLTRPGAADSSLSEPPGSNGAARDGRSSRTPRLGGRGLALAVAIAQPAVFGVSCLFSGYYSMTAWGAIALASFALIVPLLALRRIDPTPAARVALTGLGLLVAWAALSMFWAESVDNAWTEVNRLSLYTATVVIGLSALREARHARVAINVVTLAVCAVVAYLTVRMLTGSGVGLFIDDRISLPMGYTNGEAGFFLMGFWCCLAGAEPGGRPALRGVALAFSALIFDLLVLTQSRAIIPALFVSMAVILVAFPRRLGRGWALLLVVGAVGAALPWVLDVYALKGKGLPLDEATIRGAALASVLSAAVAGAVWSAVCRFAPRMNSPQRRRGAGAVAIAVPLIAVIALAVQVNDPVGHVRTQYQNFVGLHVNESASARFTDAGGYRYDLWRVAVREFSNAPVLGLGAGNYTRGYYTERRQTTTVRQPHSLELQMLSELGLPGGIALLLFVGGVFAAAFSRRQRLGLEHDVRVSVAACGLFTVWLVHTSVDWLYNLPGLTGIGLVGAAVLLRRPEPAADVPDAPEPGRALRSNRRRIALVLGLACLALLAASVGRQLTAGLYRQQAEHRVASDPVEALRAANRSLGLNPASLSSYYVKAAAYARLDRYEQARQALSEAARREPHNYVPPGLLGDLAVRHGDFSTASAEYRRASQLNPREPTLAALAANPRSVSP